MRDTRSLLLLLLSIGLVSTWIYHLYDKTQYSHKRTEVYVRDSTAIADGVRDSLNKIYSAEVKKLDNRLISSESNTDSLKNTLDSKLNDLTNLKNEIKDILKNNAVSKTDLVLARKKIDELLQRVDELKNENTSIKEETGRLNTVLKELNAEIQNLQQNIRRLNDENKRISEKINLSSFFIASEMSLNAITIKKQSEAETFLAKKTDKFVASVLVQNPLYDFSNAEVIAIVIRPDGQVLKISDSNVDRSEVKPEPTHDFTKKIKFDYSKGERRRIIFSLQPDKPQRGSYQFQIWHKGVMIGQINKTLS